MIDLLHTIATDILQSTAEILAEAALEVPERRYVQIPPVMAPIGMGPDDCHGQLTVEVDPPVPSRLVGGARGRNSPPDCGHAWDVTFTLVVFRCHPMFSELPEPEEHDVLAQAHLRDGWQLARGIAYRWSNGLLTPHYGQGSVGDPACRYSTIGAMTAYKPDGGLRGWRLPITMHVADVYDPATGR